MEVTSTLAVGITTINVDPLYTPITGKKVYLPLHDFTHSHVILVLLGAHGGLKFWTPET